MAIFADVPEGCFFVIVMSDNDGEDTESVAMPLLQKINRNNVIIIDSTFLLDRRPPKKYSDIIDDDDKVQIICSILTPY